jgi:integrase
MQKRAIHKRKLHALDGHKLKPQASKYRVWDTFQHGLVLQVQSTGYRAYKLVYRYRGRPRWLTIGRANAISLADARKIAAELMLQVLNGKDPAAERRASRHLTAFSKVHSRYLEEYAKRENKSWSQADALIRRFALPVWGDLDASTITRTDVRALLNKIDGRGMYNLVRASVSAVFSWAVGQDILTNNPVRGIECREIKSRERVLSDTEVSLFWLEFCKAGLQGTALQTLLLTGQRPGEVANMRWEHIQDGWWTLPGAPDPGKWPGTKSAQTHRVWLPTRVREMLEGLGIETSGFVFEKPRLDAVMRDVCRRLNVPRATPHDLRRTFSTTVTSLGFGRDALNRVTNHKEGGIASVYDRYQYADENKRILETVANRLLTLAEGTPSTNVVAFTLSI